MRKLAMNAAVFIFLTADPAHAEGAFDKWLTESAPECVPAADIEKVGKSIPLSDGQFQFARAIFVAIPPMSKSLPAGDRGVIVGASDGTAMIGIVDDDKICARFLAPDFVLKMLNDIKAGNVTHAGKPL